MFFLEQPEDRIKAVAHHLDQQIKVLCHEKWFDLRKTLLHYESRFASRENVPQQLHSRLKNYLNIHPLDSNRKNLCPLPGKAIDSLFKQYIFLDVTDHYQDGYKTHSTETRSNYSYLNDKKQCEHYLRLLQIMEVIHKELMSSSPDYSRISREVEEIKNADCNVPSKSDGKDISLKMGYFTGGNIVTNFFGGIINIIIHTLNLLASLFCFLPYNLTQSEWVSYGSPSFLLESIRQILNAVARVTGAVLFPLGILYSKETTDSWNVLKGEFARTTDSLISLTQKQANQPSRTTELNAVTTLLLVP